MNKHKNCNEIQDNWWKWTEIDVRWRLHHIDVDTMPGTGPIKAFNVGGALLLQWFIMQTRFNKHLIVKMFLLWGTRLWPGLWLFRLSISIVPAYINCHFLFFFFKSNQTECMKNYCLRKIAGFPGLNVPALINQSK